jgi:cytochrome c biogenesis protein CcmG/thiol:disulfide interchange protein DsbE
VIADRDGRTAIDFGVYGAPESFLVDANGIIRYKRIGAITPEVMAFEIKPRLKAMQGAGG